MRVLLVSNFFPPYWVGGYELIASWVVRGLEQRGHEIAVLTGSGPAFDGCPNVIPALDLDLASLPETYFAGCFPERPSVVGAMRRHVFSLRNLAATLDAIGERRPDLISFWNGSFITFAPLLAARIGHVPSVVHISDTALNPFRNPHPPAFPAALRNAARRTVDFALKAARPSRFVTPSAFLRQKLVTTEKLPADRVSILPWPIEPTIDAETAPPPRSAGNRIVFVGTLIPEKGADVLIEAFRRARASCPEFSLTLVGGGTQTFVDRLRAAADGLPVSFTGRLARDGVVAAYQAHDILAFPSNWDEPFAVVPLEAMAMGLAVVATTAGGTPEAIESERTGLLVPPGDAGALAAALVRLAREPGLVRRLAESGQRFARERLGFAAFIERLEALYLDLALGG